MQRAVPSQQIGAGGDCPHHLWHPLPPPPTPCALRALRSGHVTHSTTEWDAPSFGFSRESWQNERPGRRADELLGLTTVGHLWWAFVFVFLSSWKNKLIGKKRCAGTNSGVCWVFFFLLFCLVNFSVQSHGSWRGITRQKKKKSHSDTTKETMAHTWLAPSSADRLRN